MQICAKNLWRVQLGLILPQNLSVLRDVTCEGCFAVRGKEGKEFDRQLSNTFHSVWYVVELFCEY